ncbi:5'-methylthioadenosine/S-adenosylhomocysteine nucleosidase [Streptomyces sp. SID13726]|uniref:5'-methylthioadenosine/S-adenosylhomocysteine nucleosidase n=1 Tax=Streptomyces sp. SID13726 TaxID=2706058 RepID=UPI0031BB9C7E
MSDPVVVILTALALEYAAVRTHLTGREELVHAETGTRVERGRLAGADWAVALAELGEGALNTAALTTQLVSWLRPRAVLFVGVAGSLKEDIGIGDVVVGTKVYSVHGGKQTPEGFLVRPEAWPGSNALVQAARSAVRELPGVRAHFKPIASGDVVLADSGSGLARHLREHYNDAAAIETEGSGAAHAAHLDGRAEALVIRGISDHADTGKPAADASGSQHWAAEQAAAVAAEVLRRYRVRRDATEGPHRVGWYGGDHVDLRNGTFYGTVIGKRTGPPR